MMPFNFRGIPGKRTPPKYSANILNPFRWIMIKWIMIKWILNIVNKRICSAEQVDIIFSDVANQAKYDDDGFITIGEIIKMVIKSFRKIRG